MDPSVILPLFKRVFRRTDGWCCIDASGSPQTALDAWSERRGCTFINLSNRVCYVHFGADARPSQHTFRLKTWGTFKPSWPYTGLVTIVWPDDVRGALFVRQW